MRVPLLYRPAAQAGEWHRWFAWHPVIAGGCWVWLETIYRRQAETFMDSWWEYALPMRLTP